MYRSLHCLLVRLTVDCRSAISWLNYEEMVDHLGSECLATTRDRRSSYFVKGMVLLCSKGACWPNVRGWGLAYVI